jgi:hypothetical protein
MALDPSVLARRTSRAQSIIDGGTMLSSFMDNPNSSGRVSIGGQVASKAAAGAQMGMAAGPWGAAAGAVIGGAIGLVSGKAAKDKEENDAKLMQQQQGADFANMNPEQIYGNKNASYFKLGGTLRKFSDGGQLKPNLWNTDKIAFMDSTFNANKDKDWVNRLYQKNGPTIQVPGMKSLSTHLMESSDGRVYPTVVNQGNGDLKYLSGWDGRDYADKTGTAIKFKTDEQAQYVGKNYKKATGVQVGKFAEGGKVKSGAQVVAIPYASNDGMPTTTTFDLRHVSSQMDGATGKPIKMYNGVDANGKFISIPENEFGKYYQGQGNNMAITKYGRNGKPAGVDSMYAAPGTSQFGIYAGKKYDSGGKLSAFNGQGKQLNSTTVALEGPSHENGGIDLGGRGR